VLALAGLMSLAFVPLFYAVASLTRATVLDARAQQARLLADAIAAHAAGAWDAGGPSDVERALRAHTDDPDLVRAACAFGPDRRRIACAGAAPDVDGLRAPDELSSPASPRIVRSARGRALQVTSAHGGIALVARLGLGEEGDRAAALVRLVALYMLTFALALLVFAYFALTRLIVRPVDQLVAAADRVASGARTLHVPRSGARELVELGASVRSMAERLIAEEANLTLKVEELTQTQAQLVRSERMASVGRLAAGVAHEIGNPIAALVGMQELLIEGDLPPDTARDFLQRMRRETARIHAVVRDLLDFARPEEPPISGAGEPSPADVCATIDDVVALARTQKAFRDVRLDVDVEGHPCVAMPGSRLTQVVLNLVLNGGAAVAAAGRGRVTIRARSLEGRAGRRIRIEVEDDGPGIAPQVRDRLFEPFVTTKQVGDGTGLGLAVCRGLVESAGGEIGVDDTYADGARFYVSLPAAP
jgi:signal transduction histidine kinase